MSCESILEPEIGLVKQDVFYLFYEMMIQALKTDNVKEGINKSLYLLRRYLNSGNIALFRKNEDGIYVKKITDSNMDDFIKSIGCIVNKTKELSEDQGIFNLDLNLSERLESLTLIHTKVDDADCMMAIINTDKSKKLESYFWERLRDTIQIILKRASSYERNTKAITTDLLTGLDNRNSYEMRMNAFNEADEKLILAVFDLFRLKNINDNYTHTKGDEYIKKAAKILNKYWPKQKVIVNDSATEETVDTGHCVYRFGGDEFVLLTSVEELNLASTKAKLAAIESEMIDLNLGEDVPVGLNYGVVKHNPGDSLKQTFIKADDLMQDDKKKMYVKYNLERRK